MVDRGGDRLVPSSLAQPLKKRGIPGQKGMSGLIGSRPTSPRDRSPLAPGPAQFQPWPEAHRRLQQTVAPFAHTQMRSSRLGKDKGAAIRVDQKCYPAAARKARRWENDQLVV